MGLLFWAWEHRGPITFTHRGNARNRTFVSLEYLPFVVTSRAMSYSNRTLARVISGARKEQLRRLLKIASEPYCNRHAGRAEAAKRADNGEWRSSQPPVKHNDAADRVNETNVAQGPLD